MTIDDILTIIRRELIRSFAVLDEWFDKAHALHQYKPSSGKWSVPEVLEHVMLTSHYLLILIEKGGKKALAKAKRQPLDEMLKSYTFIPPALEEVGRHDAFIWERPEHMKPVGLTSLSGVRSEMRGQLNRCLCMLELLESGEGILHRYGMQVNGLGKLDLYQYIYFLALHARRHIKQLEKIEDQFNKQGTVDLVDGERG